MTLLNQIDYLPHVPELPKANVGIIGVGNIVRNQHLLAYEKYGIKVAGIFDIAQAAIDDAKARYDVGQVYPSAEALLADPTIEVVDIATHPAERVKLIHQALAAGKHVLAQKPLAINAALAQGVIDDAAEKGLKVAVNQNGRWTPPWRIATQIIEKGVIGNVISVTHLFDTNFSWVVDTIFDKVNHWLFYDYAIHWFDITRCWMG